MPNVVADYNVNEKWIKAKKKEKTHKSCKLLIITKSCLLRNEK